MRLSILGLFTSEPPATTAPLSRTEEVARDLRQWAYANTSDLALLGQFLFSTVDGFAAKTGTPHAEALDAASLIHSGGDLHSRLLNWAFDHHAVRGKKKTEVSLSRGEVNKAAIELGVSAEAVRSALVILNDEGRALAAQSGFVGRVRRESSGHTSAESPPGWGVMQPGATGVAAQGRPISAHPSVAALTSLPTSKLGGIDQASLKIRLEAAAQGALLTYGVPSGVESTLISQGMSLTDLASASQRIAEGLDITNRLYNWSADRGLVHGKKNTEVELSSRQRSLAADHFGISVHDVETVLTVLAAESRSMMATPGVISRGKFEAQES